MVKTFQDGFREITEEVISLVEKKQRLYGKEPITTFGEQGVLIRAYDKISRLRNLYKILDQVETDESIDDSWIDIIAYATFAIMLRRGTFELSLGSISNEE